MISIIKALCWTATVTFFVVSATSVDAKIVADCGAAEGNVFYAHPDRNSWADDAITGGRVLVDSLPDGSVNVIFRDAIERTVNVKDDGGAPILLKNSPDWTEFVIVVAYPETGAVETYLRTNKGGESILLWTTTRLSLGPIPPKVSAYVSKCE